MREKRRKLIEEIRNLRIAAKRRKTTRRFLAGLLTAAMTLTNILSGAGVAYAGELPDREEIPEVMFAISGDELWEAVRAAGYRDDAASPSDADREEHLNDASPADAEKVSEALTEEELKEILKLTESESLPENYEEYKGLLAGSKMLEIEPGNSVTEGTDQKIFYKDGKVVFLYINETETAVKFTTEIDGHSMPAVTVNPAGAGVENGEQNTIGLLGSSQEVKMTLPADKVAGGTSGGSSSGSGGGSGTSSVTAAGGNNDETVTDGEGVSKADEPQNDEPEINEPEDGRTEGTGSEDAEGSDTGIGDSQENGKSSDTEDDAAAEPQEEAKDGEVSQGDGSPDAAEGSEEGDNKNDTGSVTEAQTDTEASDAGTQTEAGGTSSTETVDDHGADTDSSPSPDADGGGEEEKSPEAHYFEFAPAVRRNTSLVAGNLSVRPLTANDEDIILIDVDENGDPITPVSLPEEGDSDGDGLSGGAVSRSDGSADSISDEGVVRYDEIAIDSGSAMAGAIAVPVKNLPEAIDGRGSNTSGNLKDFLVSLDVRTPDGNEIAQGDLEAGGEYVVTLTFEEPPEQKKIMRAATAAELKAAGIADNYCVDGTWMFIRLDGDVTATVVDGEQDENVVIVDDGKAILFRFPEERMDYAYITFTGTLNEGADLENVEIVKGSATGTFRPAPSAVPKVKKEATGYDPEKHLIHYKVTVTNGTSVASPSDAAEDSGVMKTVTVTDTIETEGAKLVENSIKIGDLAVAPDSSYLVKNENGNGFTLKDYPVDLGPGESVVITYDVGVTDLVVKNDKGTASAFHVDNTVSVYPNGKMESEPLTDDESYPVYLGKLTKYGSLPSDEFEFYGEHKRIIRWDIEAYDPYLNLDENGTVIIDELPNGKDDPKIKLEDIKGVFFEISDGQTVDFVDTTWKEVAHLDDLLKSGIMEYDENNNTVKFNLSRLKEPPELPPEFPKGKTSNDYFVGGSDDHRRIHIILFTQYKEGEEGHGFYQNWAKTKLPSEIDERRDEHHESIGIAGIDIRKKGELNVDGKQLDYTITMNVSQGISDYEHGDTTGGAVIRDLMSIWVDEEDVNEEDKDKYLDISEATKITSVEAKYTTETGDSETWEFTENGERGHRYKFWNVIAKEKKGKNEDGSVIYGYKKCGEDEREKYERLHVLFFNPYETQVMEDNGEVWEQIKGEWPETLNEHEVEVTVKYTVDPSKAYFVAYGPDKWYYVKQSYDGCETLADYLVKHDDVLVHNLAVGGVKDASDYTDCVLNLTNPLKKDGEVNIDPESSKRSADYTVTFHNGDSNGSAIPKGATGICFHDEFDAKMEYVEGTLKAKLVDPNGWTKEYTWQGGTPVEPQSHTFNASWANFVAEDDETHETLQENFNSQNGHYEYRFTYTLEPGEGFDQNQAKQPIENKAWVTYDGGQTNEAKEELMFPTGALTKEAVAGDGRIAFFVEINEQAADLSDTNTLTVVDESSNHEKLDFNASSVKVEKFENGGWVALSDNKYTKTIDKEGKFTLEVPDGMRLRITYEYVLREGVTGNVSITNSVSVQGKKSIIDGNTWEFSANEIRSSYGISNASLTLKKVQKGEEGTVVGNAKFILYVPNLGGEENLEARTAADSIGRSQVSYGGTDFYPAAVYTTGEDGTAEINWKLLSKNVTYALVEAEVPAGYQKLETPVFFRIDKSSGHSGDVEIVGDENTDVTANGNEMTIANEYIPDAVSVDLVVNKVVEGNPPEDSKEKFNFKLKDSSGNDLGNIEITGSGRGRFNPIVYGKEDIGTHIYTITETAGTANGYTYDSSVWTVTVVVSQNVDGALTAETTYSKDDSTITNNSAAVFTNTYAPAETTFTPQIEKVIAGDYVDSESFSFTLVPSRDNPEGASLTDGAVWMTTISGASSKQAKTKSFGKITFTKPGTYNFSIAEVNDRKAGYTYAKPWNLQVTVEDIGGQLKATGVYTNSDESDEGNNQSNTNKATFTNIYEVKPVDFNPQVSKAYSGAKRPDDKTFTFNLEAGTYSPVDGSEEAGVTLPTSTTAAVTGTGIGTFGAIQFTKAGTYTFKIREEEGNPGIPGYTYDSSEWTLTVDVTDQNGQLVVTDARYEKDGVLRRNNAEFINVYSVEPTTAVIGVSKTVTGDVPSGTNPDFTFNLTQLNPDSQQDGAELPADTEITAKAGGTSQFDEITFTKAGTYTFQVTEVPGSAAGYSYDGTVYEVEITVKDIDSLLTVTKRRITKILPDQTEETTEISDQDAAAADTMVAFTNEYNATEVTFAPQVNKQITGDVRPVQKTFAFTLEPEGTYPSDSMEMSSEESAKRTTVTGEGTASFAGITFKKAGEYRFKIKEVSEETQGYIYDKSEWELVVTVTDTNAVLAAAGRYEKADGTSRTDYAAFVNSYDAADTTYTPSVRKAVAGAGAPSETFEFTMTAAGDNPEGASLTAADGAQSAAVTGAGRTDFGEITFTRAGTYKFAITETADNVPENWEYDDSQWTLTIVVEDQDGRLAVTGHSYANDAADPAANSEAAVFTNIYTEPGSLRISKTVSGNNGETERDFHFTVTLTDEAGSALAGSYSYTGSKSGTVENGTLEVTLRNGESITIADLPAGTRYTVAEAEANTEGYATTVSGGETGVIASGETAEAAYTNSRSTTTPDNPGGNPGGGNPGGGNPGGPGPGNPTPIGENETPLGGMPPIENISEAPTPLSSFKNLENIDDEDVPLMAMVPMTGDETPVGAVGAFAVLALGLMGAFAHLGFKKKEEE